MPPARNWSRKFREFSQNIITYSATGVTVTLEGAAMDLQIGNSSTL
jgi:hypothetical protein